MKITLELKLIANIGLVGYPNAGKSTLLKAICKARPKIASYPFTTIQPNIGIIKYDDLRRISVADLPGLIEGAHRNIGMGHRFLRHVERTQLIAMIVDINGFQFSLKHPKRTCVETVLALNKELELYKKELIEKPAVLFVNKMDVDGACEKYEEIKHALLNLKDHLSNYSEEFHPERLLQFDSIVPISAKTSPADIQMVKDKLRNILDVYYPLEEEPSEEETMKKLKKRTEEYQKVALI